MRFAIMGSGGLGCFFGGFLTKAGHDVTFVSRGANLQALQTQGLTVRPFDQTEFHTDVKATDSPAEIGPVDLVWFCVKTYDIDTAAEQIRPVLGEHTMVLPLQNGVESAQKIGAIVGEDRVLGGVCSGSATLQSPGVVVGNTQQAQVKFGEMVGGTSSRTETLRGELQDAGIDTELSSDISVVIWQKFVAACMGLGLSALVRLPMGPMLAHAETSALAYGVMEEAEAVGRAEGIQLPTGAARGAFEIFTNLAKDSPGVRGSMYFDLIAGRRLELDAMNGAVVRIGRKYSVPTPLNFRCRRRTRALRDGHS
jgi:2-dehydropantoate 2-reductase